MYPNFCEISTPLRRNSNSTYLRVQSPWSAYRAGLVVIATEPKCHGQSDSACDDHKSMASGRSHQPRLEAIYEELSVTRASEALRQLVGDVREPYRAILKPLRDAVRRQRDELGASFKTGHTRCRLYSTKMSLAPTAVSNIACRSWFVSYRDASCSTHPTIRLFGAHLVTLDVVRRALATAM